MAMLLLALAGAAQAADCTLDVEANDMVEFSARSLKVDPACTEVAVTLHHVGSMQAQVLGHDWVLSRSADVAALVAAGSAAGAEHGFLPAGDARIIAATRVIGGGESTSVRFSTAALVPGGDYSFFCSFPGHMALMRGRFLFGDAAKVAGTLRP
jgi:azurin